MGALGDARPGAQAGEGADADAGADVGALEMREGENFGAVADRDTGAEHHVGANGDVAPEAGVETEEHARRIEQRGAPGHGPLPQPILNHGFGRRQLGPGIDAHELRRRPLDDGRGQPVGAGQGDDVGEIVLALGVVVAEAPQEAEQVLAVDRHDPGIAEIDGKLVGRRVAGFDDGLEDAARPGDQAAVGARRVRPEAEHDE